MVEKKKPGIVEYIAKKRGENVPDARIVRNLIDAGWQMDIVMKAMHGDPIKRHSLDPILDIKNRPIRKPLFIILPILLIVSLVLLVLFL